MWHTEPERRGIQGFQLRRPRMFVQKDGSLRAWRSEHRPVHNVADATTLFGEFLTVKKSGKRLPHKVRRRSRTCPSKSPDSAYVCEDYTSKICYKTGTPYEKVFKRFVNGKETLDHTAEKSPPKIEEAERSFVENKRTSIKEQGNKRRGGRSKRPVFQREWSPANL